MKDQLTKLLQEINTMCYEVMTTPLTALLALIVVFITALFPTNDVVVWKIVACVSLYSACVVYFNS